MRAPSHNYRVPSQFLGNKFFAESLREADRLLEDVPTHHRERLEWAARIVSRAERLIDGGQLETLAVAEVVLFEAAESLTCYETLPLDTILSEYGSLKRRRG